MPTAAPHETFPALAAEVWLRHGFLQRVTGLDVQVDREAALARLDDYHRAALTNIGLADRKFVTAQQVHGKNVVRVDSNSLSPIPDCDGLLTNDPNIALGIYTADCGAIFLADPEHRAIGLLHSGKKGTELGILTVAIEKMRVEFGSNPGQIIVQLAPCIRPPHYEIDFAAQIAAQAGAAGIAHYADCGKCTASDLATYYSYRAELGKTGRLLAVLGYAD
ncbi:MAG: polyphenol oxidase family protein [Chthoniobacterales bacterium]